MEKLYPLIYALSLVLPATAFAQDGVYEETLSYCGSEMQQYGIGGASSIDLGVASFYPQIVEYEGNSIARVRLGLVGSVTNAYVFVSQSLDGEPLYEQRVPNLHTGWNEVELATPVVIGQEPLYVGYTCRVPGGAYSVGISTVAPRENGLWLDSGSGYADMSDTYSPLALQVVVSGSNFAANAASVQHVSHSFVAADGAGDATIPQVVTISNDGAEAISSLEVRYSIGGDSDVKQIADLSIPRYATGDVTIDLPVQPAGDYDVTYELTSVNGVANESATASYTAAKRVHVMSESYQRIAVCEEYCGDLCGYCPAGIVAIEQLNEKYPDTFIAIAAHVFNSNDPYYLWDYEAPMLAMTSTAPSFVINRSRVLTQAFPADGTRSGRNLIEENALKGEWAEPTCGQVAVSADMGQLDGTSLEVTVATTFNVAMEQSPFSLCLVATESGLAGTQSNSYSGGQILMDGWEELPSMVDVEYDDVAIALVDFYGIEGSLPQSIAAGEAYEYTHSIDLSRASNIDNVDIIALLVNTETGEVANAGSLKRTSGIGQVVAAGRADFDVKTMPDGLTIYASKAGKRTYRLFTPSGAVAADVATAGQEVTVVVKEKGFYILQIVENGCNVYTRKLIVK